MVDDWFAVRQVAEGMVGALAAAGNILVLVAILSTPALRTSTNSLLCSLAFADTCVGLIGIPLVIVSNMEFPHHFYGCLFINCAVILFTYVSVFNLVAIALERFIAIRFAIFHRNHFSLKSKKAVLVFIFVAWFMGFVVGFIPLMGWHLYPDLGPRNTCQFLAVIAFEYLVYFAFFGFFLIPLTIIYVTYVSIFFIIFRRSKRMSLAGTVDNETKAGLSREAKAARRIFVVVLTFTVCWLPIHILNTISFFTPFFNYPALVVSIFLSHLNSAINPLIYAWGNPKIRAAVCRVLRIKTNEIQAAGGSGGVESTTA